jgi:hypothetical protein
MDTTFGFYSGPLPEFISSSVGLLVLIVGAQFLAYPDRRGFWIIYIAWVITLGGFVSPGPSPLSFFPGLAFIRWPAEGLLAMTGNVVVIITLVATHIGLVRHSTEQRE